MSSATIDNSTFTSNRSLDEGGGAIYAEAPLTISDSTFEDDTATENGGVIVFNNGDTLTIYDSVFTNNERRSSAAPFTSWGRAHSLSTVPRLATTMRVNTAVLSARMTSLRLPSATLTSTRTGRLRGTDSMVAEQCLSMPVAVTLTSRSCRPVS